MDTYMRELGAKRLWPVDTGDLATFGDDLVSRPRELDQIWELNGELIVVECKGVSSPLKGKWVRNEAGARIYAEQGTKEYLIGTLEEMIAKGGDAKLSAEKVYIRLNDITQQKSVRYFNFIQGFDEAGQLTKPNILEFKINFD